MIRISKHDASVMLQAIVLSAMVFVGALSSATAQNKPAPAAAPVEQPSTQILSDTLHYDDIKRESTFTGNVVMTRGLMTMNADTLILKEESDGSQFGTGTVKPGKRVFIRQERPENFEVLEGVGERVEYNGRDEIFDLIGQAIVTRFICGQQFDTVSGEKVRYSQKTDTYEAFSGPNSANSGGRVRSVAQPRARTDAAVAACRAKQGAAAGKNPIPAMTVPSTNPGKN
jgi:lipopolysaccharide export system protein LptA